jgi:hypothetical protein
MLPIVEQQMTTTKKKLCIEQSLLVDGDYPFLQSWPIILCCGNQSLNFEP